MDAALASDCPSKLDYPIESRTYEISESLDGVIYSWEECTKRFIVCFKWVPVVEEIKFTNKSCMLLFRHKGMVMRTRRKH